MQERTARGEEEGRTVRGPRILRIAAGLFLLAALVWLILGGWQWSRGSVMLAALMLGNAVALAGLGWGLGKRKKAFYYAAVGYLLLNLVLTVMDEFGILDLLYLALMVGMLGFLVVTRAEFLRGGGESS